MTEIHHVRLLAKAGNTLDRETFASYMIIEIAGTNQIPKFNANPITCPPKRG